MKKYSLFIIVCFIVVALLSGCSNSFASNIPNFSKNCKLTSAISNNVTVTKEPEKVEVITDKIVFYGASEPLFEKAIKTVENQNFEGVYCKTVEEINNLKNIKGIISVLSYVNKPNVAQIWIGDNFPDVPLNTATYTVVNEELATEFINTVLTYPPHDTPVRLISMLSPSSDLEREFNANVAAGKIYSRANYVGDIPVEEWISQTLDTFPAGTIDGVVASSATDALMFYNALTSLGRDDMEVFSYEGNKSTLNAYFENPEVFAAYIGITKDTLNSAALDIATAIQQDLILESKELIGAIMVDETLYTS